MDLGPETRAVGRVARDVDSKICCCQVKKAGERGAYGECSADGNPFFPCPKRCCDNGTKLVSSSPVSVRRTEERALSTPSDAPPERPIYVAGEWAATAEALPGVPPGTLGRPLAITYHAGVAEFERAVRAAVEAEEPMAALSSHGRSLTQYEFTRRVRQGRVR